MDSLRQQFLVCLDMRVSIVAYRDHCSPEKERLELQPFSRDVNESEAFLAQLKAAGGGDAPEDVQGGLRLALEQKWEAKTRYAVLLADAPCHGNKYHEPTIKDNYPDGDPNGSVIEDQMVKFAQLGVHFNVVKITPSTDIMFQIMDKYYQEGGSKRPIEIAELG